MLSKVLDMVGLACMVAFTYFLWHPASLLTLGVSLILVSLLFDDVKPRIGRRKKSS